MKKQKVVCIKESSIHNKVKEGEFFILDLDSVMGDYEGTWFGMFYDLDDFSFIGRFDLRRFRSIEGVD